jgi:hypothetical protein
MRSNTSPLGEAPRSILNAGLAAERDRFFIWWSQNAPKGATLAEREAALLAWLGKPAPIPHLVRWAQA